MPKGKLRVPAEKLRRIFNPEEFSFKDTSSMQSAQGFIGQERAVEALRFGLEIESHEYHIFGTGHLGTGRKAVLRDFLEKFAEEKMAEGAADLHDICYIYNFDQPARPKLLILRKGRAKKLKEHLDHLLEELKVKISSLASGDKFLKPREKIMGEFEEEGGRLEEEFRDFAEKEGFTLLKTPVGLNLASKMSTSSYAQLSEEEKRLLDKKHKALEKELNKLIFDLARLHEDAQLKIEKLKHRLVAHIMRPDFRELAKECSGHPVLIDYLEKLGMYVLDNMDSFLPSNEMGEMQHNGHNGNGCFTPFKVNILIENGEREKPPIVFEANPSFINLFGDIEKKFIQGVYFTDHTCLKAGSILAANGGYLVLNFWDVVKQPGVWEKLKRTLKSQHLEIEEPLNYLGLISANLKPESIPVDLKVIVMGDSLSYQLLSEYDPDFTGIFKTKVEFDSEMPLNPKNIEAYAKFVVCYCQLPLDAGAVAKVAEYGIRLTGDQKKLSTQFDRIKDLAKEADYWAKKDRSARVTAGHVQKALDSRRRRLNLTEEKIQEAIKDCVILIDTDEEKVGQINALTVYSFGDCSFGAPTRITAKTFAGNQGLVSIQREVKLSGPIHNQGVLILHGYFGEKYGKYKAISFSASICFEQAYHGIEGDSASAAELISLISSLSGLPINQGFAMTGSVNQFGEIQPIGGVNEKIEGFFDVCKERGLTGSQGVAIPHQNVQNLMLREDVVETVKAGKFHIYEMKTIDDGIELLLAKPVEEVHQKVAEYLKEISKEEKSESNQ